MAHTLRHFCSYSSIGTDTHCCSNGAGFLFDITFCRWIAAVGAWSASPCILPQFLTLILLSYICFVVFLYVLFSRKKNQKLPAHGLSKSLPFFARATSCEHSVERRLSLVSAVPISGTKELASRTPGIVWHTRSDTFVLVPLLELTRAVAQTVPDLFFILPFVRGFPQA